MSRRLCVGTFAARSLQYESHRKAATKALVSVFPASDVHAGNKAKLKLPTKRPSSSVGGDGKGVSQNLTFHVLCPALYLYLVWFLLISSLLQTL